MKINNITALDYSITDDNLVMSLVDTSMDDITSMDTSVLTVTTDKGDIVEVIAGYRLRSVAYDLEDAVYIASLTIAVDDVTGKIINSLTDTMILLRSELENAEATISNLSANVESAEGTIATLSKTIEYTAGTAGIMFVLEAQSDNPRFDNITIMEHASFFTVWDSNYIGARSSIVQRDIDGTVYLYKALHDITSAYSSSKPEETPTLWKLIGNPNDEAPMWSQPIAGVDNMYVIGDKVTHDGIVWVSDINNNSWKPGVYGWSKA